MKELIRYLMDNLYLDFQGEIAFETICQYLKRDTSREAQTLLKRLNEEKGADDLLIALADCLKEHIRNGINEEVFREQLTLYTES